MRTIILFALFLLTSVYSSAQSNTLSLGADIQNGSISLEYDVSERSAARFDIDLLFGDYNQILLKPEYHFHKVNNAMDLGGSGILTPYHGPGVVVGVGENETLFAIEFVWGLEYDLNDVPFEIFLDAGPHFQFEPVSIFALATSFGMRYKF